MSLNKIPVGLLIVPNICPNCKQETYFQNCEYEYCCEKCGFVIEDNIQLIQPTEHLFANYSYTLKKKVIYKKKNYLKKILKEKEIPFEVLCDIIKLFGRFEYRFFNSEIDEKRKYFINYSYLIRKILTILNYNEKKYFKNGEKVNLLNLKKRFKKIKPRSIKQNRVIYKILEKKLYDDFPDGLDLNYELDV